MSHEVVCFQMLEFETSNSKSEVSKSNNFFLENYITSGKPFLKMFYNYQSTAFNKSMFVVWFVGDGEREAG